MRIETEDFSCVISSLALAKGMHDIGKPDVVKTQFADELFSYDAYYENIMAVIQSVFSNHYSSFDDDDYEEKMFFGGDVISEYFVHAMEYGKRNKLHHDSNPYVVQAQAEARRWFSGGTCVDWKLLAYTKTRKTAKRSRLIIYHYTGCGCNAIEGIAYRLIQLYKWFMNKCAEIAAEEARQNKLQNGTVNTCPDYTRREVIAA